MQAFVMKTNTFEDLSEILYMSYIGQSPVPHQWWENCQ